MGFIGMGLEDVSTCSGLSGRPLRRKLVLNPVSGIAGHLLSRCFNLHLVDPMKHVNEIFPFSRWLPGSSDPYV